MNSILIFGLISGCLSAWLLTLAYKWGIVEYIQSSEKLPKLINKLASCDFCMSWWVSVAICLVAAVAAGEWLLVVSVFVSTMISRHLLG